jgi:hypothetical protein
LNTQACPASHAEDAYSHRQFARLVNAATRAGIRVVPIVNLLGHTQYLIKVPELRDLNELRDARRIGRWSAGRSARCTRARLKSRRNCSATWRRSARRARCTSASTSRFTSANTRCRRREIARIGLRRALRRLRAVDCATSPTASGCEWECGRTCCISCQKRFRSCRADVAAYDWYYYKFTRRPRVELFNFAESDLSANVCEHSGIEYWGCPMNGAFRYEPLPHVPRSTGQHHFMVAPLPAHERLGISGHLVGSQIGSRSS